MHDQAVGFHGERHARKVALYVGERCAVEWIAKLEYAPHGTASPQCQILVRLEQLRGPAHMNATRPEVDDAAVAQVQAPRRRGGNDDGRIRLGHRHVDEHRALLDARGDATGINAHCSVWLQWSTVDWASHARHCGVMRTHAAMTRRTAVRTLARMPVSCARYVHARTPTLTTASRNAAEARLSGHLAMATA